MMKKDVRKRIKYSALLALTGHRTLTGCTPGSSSKGKRQQMEGIETIFAFFAVPGKIAPGDNRVLRAIEEKTSVKVTMDWLTGKQPKRIGVLIAGGEYPVLSTGVMVLSNW